MALATISKLFFRQRAALFLILITFIAFISLGLPDGLLDIANPRIRDTFGIGTDLFGLIFVTGLIGYALSSFFAGQLVMRLGIGLLLSASCFTTAAALLGYALSPGWGWFVVLGLLAGAGGGAIDTGLNTYVATHHGARLMFWLHASFGLGVTFGTWLMSLVVNAGQPWRLGYAMVGTMQIGLALCFLFTRARWNQPNPRRSLPSASPQVLTPVRDSLRVPLVWFGIALFFLYTGVEVTAGRWSSSLLMEARRVNPAAAGMWVSAYWGMFTVGRVAAGLIVRWLSPLAFIRLSMGGALLAALLLVWNPLSWSGGVALGIMGFAFAPIFPILISVTPRRVGQEHAANTIGFQIGAAAIGGSVLPALTGILARATSLEAMPALLLIVNAAMLILHELMIRQPHLSAVSPAVPKLETEATGIPGDR